MADKKFPKEMQFLASAPEVRKVFVADVQRTGVLDCENCGGVEVIAVFIATKGPFQAPAAPYSSDGETSHFDADVGSKGGWWVGKTYTFPCPVCIGDRPQPAKPITPPKQSAYPVQREIGRLLHPATKERLE